MTTLERAAAAVEDQMASDDNMPEDIARAVLIAIREPSETMIEEGYESYTADGGSLRDVFMNMIDAALGE